MAEMVGHETVFVNSHLPSLYIDNLYLSHFHFINSRGKGVSSFERQILKRQNTLNYFEYIFYTGNILLKNQNQNNTPKKALRLFLTKSLIKQNYKYLSQSHFL